MHVNLFKKKAKWILTKGHHPITKQSTSNNIYYLVKMPIANFLDTPNIPLVVRILFVNVEVSIMQQQSNSWDELLWFKLEWFTENLFRSVEKVFSQCWPVSIYSKIPFIIALHFCKQLQLGSLTLLTKFQIHLFISKISFFKFIL